MINFVAATAFLEESAIEVCNISPGANSEAAKKLLQPSRTAGELPSGWTMPPVRSEDQLNERFDPDKPPPEILDVFENQRYISKLIQWSLEASKRERSRPHLVKNDDDPEKS